MDFDDFRRIEIGRGELGELHGENRPNGKVRRDENTDVRVLLGQLFQALQTFVTPPRCAHDTVDAVADQKVNIVFR